MNSVFPREMRQIQLQRCCRDANEAQREGIFVSDDAHKGNLLSLALRLAPKATARIAT